jgi:hypothetical protein
MKKLMMLIALLILSIISTPAQHQHTTVTIKGSDHPELIPDDVAYQSYFLRLLDHLDNEAKRPEGVQVVLAQSGLNEVDQTVLKTNVIAYGIKRKAWENKHNSTNFTDVDAYKASIQYGTVTSVMDTVKKIKSELSPESFIRLQTFIQSVKRNTNIVRGTE